MFPGKVLVSIFLISGGFWAFGPTWSWIPFNAVFWILTLATLAAGPYRVALTTPMTAQSVSSAFSFTLLGSIFIGLSLVFHQRYWELILCCGVFLTSGLMWPKLRMQNPSGQNPALFAQQAYLAAVNALLAEYDLGLIGLVPENSFAATLKESVISSLGSDTGNRFDQKKLVESFNKESRLVQLNFVAMGLEKLGHRPFLAGENWQPVKRPLLIKDIESKVDKATQDISNRHGVIVKIQSSRLSIKEWGLADEQTEHIPQPVLADEEPSIKFMQELPDPNSNQPAGIIQSGSALVMYYENAKTIGEMALKKIVLYKYPQVAVIVSEEKKPILIVRVEESSLGTSMLCAIEPTGIRSNFGPFSSTDQNTFLRKVKEVTSNTIQFK